MKALFFSRIVLAATAAILTGSIGLAGEFAWNSDINLRLFSDAKNWDVGGSPAANPPGPSDDVVSPMLYGICSISGEQSVNNFRVQIEKKWHLIGKGTMTINGELNKSGKEVIFRDGGLSTVNFEVNVLGGLTLNNGLLRFGQDGDNAELNSLNVEGPVVVLDGELSFRCVNARLNGGLKMERGVVSIFNSAGPGGITVNGISGTEGAICATQNAALPAEAVLTIQVSGSAAQFGGSIENGAAGTLAMVKSGTGTQILTNGENRYTGGTVITEGMLIVENASGSATGSGPVVVNGSGVLGGKGLVNGPVEIAAGGALAPGTETEPMAVLKLGGGLSVTDARGMIVLQIGGGRQDQVMGAGKFQPGGRLIIAVNGRSHRSANLFSGFQTVPEAHFAEVSLAGDLAGKFSRTGNIWTATVGRSRWAFDESTGVLTIGL